MLRRANPFEHDPKPPVESRLYRLSRLKCKTRAPYRQDGQEEKAGLEFVVRFCGQGTRTPGRLDAAIVNPRHCGSKREAIGLAGWTTETCETLCRQGHFTYLMTARVLVVRRRSGEEVRDPRGRGFRRCGGRWQVAGDHGMVESGRTNLPRMPIMPKNKFVWKRRIARGR